MKVGCALPQSGALASGENLIRVAKRAEELGYDSVSDQSARPLSAVARRKLARQFPERLRPDRDADVRRRAHAQRAIGDERAGFALSPTDPARAPSRHARRVVGRAAGNLRRRGLVAR